MKTDKEQTKGMCRMAIWKRIMDEKYKRAVDEAFSKPHKLTTAEGVEIEYIFGKPNAD